jgi:uncharacterized protein
MVAYLACGSPAARAEPECWLHPDVQIGSSSIAQLGLFARAHIPQDAIVSRVGGRSVTGGELRQLFSEAARLPDHPYVDTITVGEGLHLLQAGQPNHYGNHSCDPNPWWADASTPGGPAAHRGGEKVTSDYATSTGVAGFAMDCACGSSLCRRVITGEDCRLPELQARYGDHWVPVLLARIGQAGMG